MTWIIWCDYICYFDYSSSHLIFYKLSNSGLSLKRWLFSFSIIYSFLQLNFRLMNHYIFFITLFWVNIQFYVCFLVLHHRPSLPLIAFVWFLFDIILSYFESENYNLYQNTILIYVCTCFSTIWVILGVILCWVLIIMIYYLRNEKFE